MIQQGQVLKLKAKRTDGEPLWAYRYRGRGSARRQVGGFRDEDGGADCAPQGAQSDRSRRRSDHDGRSAIWSASTLLGFISRAGDGGEAALAARQGDRDARRNASCAAFAEAGVRVAADSSGRAPIRSDPGAAAGLEPRGRPGSHRVQPGEASHPQLATSAQGEATV